jgi:hypothetical protein
MKPRVSPGKKTFTAMLNKTHSRREVLVGSAAAGAMVVLLTCIQDAQLARKLPKN